MRELFDEHFTRRVPRPLSDHLFAAHFATIQIIVPCFTQIEFQRMNELRSQYAIADIHIADSDVHPCYSYDSFLGADYIADLSDYSGEYSGSHDYWDDYDGEYYDEVDEVDYEDYMGM